MSTVHTGRLARALDWIAWGYVVLGGIGVLLAAVALMCGLVYLGVLWLWTRDLVSIGVIALLAFSVWCAWRVERTAPPWEQASSSDEERS